MATYQTNIGTYVKVITVNVSFTCSRGFTPTITGPVKFKSDVEATYTFDLTDLEIESLTVTNAQYTWSAPTLTLRNPTADVTVSYVCASTDTCVMYIGGSSGGETNRLAAYPNGGTVQYTNKYNELVNLNIADLDLYYSYSPSGTINRLNANKDDVLTGTRMVISNVSVYLYAYQPTSRVSELRISNNEDRYTYDYTRSYSGSSGTTASATFTYTINSVQKYHDSQSYREWDILIKSTAI